MKQEKYKVRVSKSFLQYEFHSVGPKGRILKRVFYEKSLGSGSEYNLSFGDVDDNNEINDLVVTDNKDSIKVLATVAFTVASFLNAYPNKLIYVKGSTAARTRLYRIAISNNLEEFRRDFNIYGLTHRWKPFRRNVGYTEFIVSKRNSKIRRL